MSKSLRYGLSYTIMVFCCLVAVADFVTTWAAISYNPSAVETGIMASWAFDNGGFPLLIVMDTLVIGILVGLAYYVYKRYKSTLAVVLLLMPYICVGIVASTNNGIVAY